MPTADLSRKASIATMEKLGSLHEMTEAPGREPTTTADEFFGRKGFEAGFLDGWNMPIPKVTGSRKDDIRELKGGGTELKYQHFSVQMSIERRMPLLTAVNIDGANSKKVPRISTWSFDGRLDKTHQWGDELYAGNALDRGHMVRREDPVWGGIGEAKVANADTFHFTNSCPQMAGVNQKTWVGLENYILSHTREDNMRVNVFTGPVFTDEDLEYRGALVPLSFWKVVAIVKDDGTPSATAYQVKQEKELSDLEFVFAGYKTFQISIREVIELTGIDFSELAQYDGFSQHEAAGNPRVGERLEDLESVRI
jgi:endonuclease G, mitochondrial